MGDRPAMRCESPLSRTGSRTRRPPRWPGLIFSVRGHWTPLRPRCLASWPRLGCVLGHSPRVAVPSESGSPAWPPLTSRSWRQPVGTPGSVGPPPWVFFLGLVFPLRGRLQGAPRSPGKSRTPVGVSSAAQGCGAGSTEWGCRPPGTLGLLHREGPPVQSRASAEAPDPQG